MAHVDYFEAVGVSLDRMAEEEAAAICEAYDSSGPDEVRKVVYQATSRITKCALHVSNGLSAHDNIEEVLVYDGDRPNAMHVRFEAPGGVGSCSVQKTSARKDWEQRFAELEIFVSENGGKMPRRGSVSGVEKSLAVWTTEQKRRLKMGLLNEQKAVLLAGLLRMELPDPAGNEE